ncbi:MAG: sugar phosphate isomerase/epimerase [Geobacter sp.]|nr:MAG: sugar phosphate isomerase/epimerase [Geobacter sp.]
MLTYCTNIHPGESWEEISTNIWRHVPVIKAAVSPTAPFPIGLRLSARAAQEITPRAAARFQDQCNKQSCFVPTINGFPYGSFSSGTVKVRAYLPDWRSRKRAEYTRDLARLLQMWLPSSMTGSISSVPVGRRDHIKKEDLPYIRGNILVVLKELQRSAAQGKKIVLALEPEPGCFLERAEDVASFIERLCLPSELRPYLGVCFDCCHSAVAFENPREAFSLLADAEIPVAKIHVSSAVRLTTNHSQGVRPFCEPRYCHQTYIKKGDEVVAFHDISEALAAGPASDQEWRIHYHLPIFDDGTSLYGTTNWFIKEVLACRPPGALLEIETYTYDILPAAIRAADVASSICREFQWLRSCL